jgi:hypothetical protein
MPTIASSTNLTLMDRASRIDDGGKTSTIVESLNQTNECLDDMVWIEANDGTGHKTTIRSGLPSAAWRTLNYGIQPSKSQTVQVRDQCGMLEAYSEIDKRLVSLQPDPGAFRASEDSPFIEAMNQNFLSSLFYGDLSANPERFMGLAPRFNLSTAENGLNIIKADTGASGSDQTSIWMVVWGEQTIHGIYPRGTQAGLKHEDLGEQTLFDANGGRYQGYRSHYTWDCGLSVRDWRYVVRIANVDTSALTVDGATGTKLWNVMAQALERIPDINKGRPVFYVNRTVREFLRTQFLNKSTYLLSMDTIQQANGNVRRVLGFDGIPIKRCDQILNTEAIVS